MRFDSINAVRPLLFALASRDTSVSYTIASGTESSPVYILFVRQQKTEKIESSLSNDDERPALLIFHHGRCSIGLLDRIWLDVHM